MPLPHVVAGLLNVDLLASFGPDSGEGHDDAGLALKRYLHAAEVIVAILVKGSRRSPFLPSLAIE